MILYWKKYFMSSFRSFKNIKNNWHWNKQYNFINTSVTILLKDLQSNTTYFWQLISNIPWTMLSVINVLSKPTRAVLFKIDYPWDLITFLIYAALVTQGYCCFFTYLRHLAAQGVSICLGPRSLLRHVSDVELHNCTHAVLSFPCSMQSIVLAMTQ